MNNNIPLESVLDFNFTSVAVAVVNNEGAIAVTRMKVKANTEPAICMQQYYYHYTKNYCCLFVVSVHNRSSQKTI